ncbi:MAG: hypothetical protein ACFFD5_03680 [Candidatus Thorarchaeota archaeon]
MLRITRTMKIPLWAPLFSQLNPNNLAFNHSINKPTLNLKIINDRLNLFFSKLLVINL